MVTIRYIGITPGHNSKKQYRSKKSTVYEEKCVKFARLNFKITNDNFVGCTSELSFDRVCCAADAAAAGLSRMTLTDRMLTLSISFYSFLSRCLSLSPFAVAAYQANVFNAIFSNINCG